MNTKLKTEKIEVDDAEKEDQVILTELCRICLNKNVDNANNIFDKHLGDLDVAIGDNNLDEDDYNIRLCDAIQQLSVVTVSIRHHIHTIYYIITFIPILLPDDHQFTRNDGLPERICSDCEIRVIDAFILKRVTEKSNDTLQQLNAEIISEEIDSAGGAAAEDDNIVFVHSTDKRDVFNISVPELNDAAAANNKVGSIIHISALPVATATISSIIKKRKVAASADGEDAVSFLLNTHAAVEPLQVVSRQRKNNAAVLQEATAEEKQSKTAKKQQPAHDEKRNHECTVCNKRFSRRSNLVDHLRLHADVRPYVCSVCDKSFVQKGNLISHMRTHTLERPYACDTCGKAYSQSSALTVHIRSHTNERNYQCDFCYKAFTNASDRRKHERIHDESSQIKCQFCNKTFAQNINYQKHVDRFHADESIIGD